jgi:quinol monooxygenase YgiN
MIRKIARFKVRPDKIDAAQQAITTFVDAIKQHEPHTVYDAYQLEDGVSFLHFMAFPDADSEQAHQRAPYTLAFVDVLYPICEELPLFTDLRLVRSAE